MSLVMEFARHQLFLVNNRTEKFSFSKPNHDGMQRSSIRLYDSKGDKFKFSIPESLTENSSTREVASKTQLAFMDGQISIELFSTWNQLKDHGTIYSRMTFNDDLKNKLSTLLAAPIIFVQATFSNKNIPFSSATSIAITLEDDGSKNQFDSVKQTFSASEYPGILLDAVTYSIILEWKTLDAPLVYSPSGVTGKINKCNVLEKLWKDKTLEDCVIFTADNMEIKCHRNILAVNSEVFHAMLTNGFQESQTNRIEMSDLSGNAVNELLSYLYCQEINTVEMQHEMAFDLLQAAHKYKITSLEADMMESLLNQLDDSFNMNTVLALYYFAVNVEHFNALCEKSLNILRRNPDGLVSSSTYQDLLEKNSKEAALLALKLLKLGSK